MKAKPLWKISIATIPEAEDAVSELLQSVAGEPVSSYTDVETLETTVAAYLSSEPHSSAFRRNLAQGLDAIKRCGLATGSGKVSVQRIRREDWAESWKRHFKAIEIGSALLIKPSWIKRKLRQGQAVVVLDPGLSFGTGQHPTTSFCLRQLVEHRGVKGGIRPSLLDVGTGSGILAIAAVKLGYAPIEAFDFDPESVRVAKENAGKNRVANKLKITRADLTKLPKRSAKRYDVVCANLISTLLVAERDRILNRLKPDGVLIIAGILEKEFGEVQKAFERAGLKMIAARTEKEWRSGAFTRG
ncbi:MAG TPA: 50S ribosomal protein L11 methyltransferase [Candidatus Paceibacterota bacterium]|nr:50S ribosomal protein L11 methyltransferase [Candidatus Paceibacterota bacterium]